MDEKESIKIFGFGSLGFVSGVIGCVLMCYVLLF